MYYDGITEYRIMKRGNKFSLQCHRTYFSTVIDLGSKNWETLGLFDSYEDAVLFRDSEWEEVKE